MSDTVTYTLNEDELFCALWHARRSNTRLIGQTVVLLLIGLPALVGLFCGFRDTAGWLLGTVLPLLAVLQWVLPWISFRREAKALAAQKAAITITLQEDTLSIADETVALCNAELRRVGTDMLLWKVASQWIAMPRRVWDEAAWDILCKEAEA